MARRKNAKPTAARATIGGTLPGLSGIATHEQLDAVFRPSKEIRGENIPSHKPLPKDESADLELVKTVLRSIAQDPTAQASARAQAARTLAEMIGAIGRNAKPPADGRKALNEMTREELEAELNAETQ